MSIPVNEVVLLQAVQDYRLCAIKETTNSSHREGRGGRLGRKRQRMVGEGDNTSTLAFMFLNFASIDVENLYSTTTPPESCIVEEDGIKKRG